MSIEKRINVTVDAIISRRKDTAQMIASVERLSKALGLTIALAAQGDPKIIDEMITGAESYAHSTAVKYSGLAAISKLEGK